MFCGWKEFPLGIHLTTSVGFLLIWEITKNSMYKDCTVWKNQVLLANIFILLLWILQVLLLQLSPGYLNNFQQYANMLTWVNNLSHERFFPSFHPDNWVYIFGRTKWKCSLCKKVRQMCIFCFYIIIHIYLYKYCSHIER